MKTRIFIFNDRNVPMRLQIQDSAKPYVNSLDELSNKYLTIEPAKGKTVEVEFPEGFIPYLKIWETGLALLSYIDQEIESFGD